MNALSERALKIAELNDAFRAGCASAASLPHGSVFITRGVNALEPGQIQAVLAAVAGFDAFDADNDPYREHDFGSIVVCGETVFWKIDAYQKGSDFLMGAEAPDDPSSTDRVLTIMLSHEY